MVGRQPPHTEPAPQWRAIDSTSRAPCSTAWRMPRSEIARQWQTTMSAAVTGEAYHRRDPGVDQGQRRGQGKVHGPGPPDRA